MELFIILTGAHPLRIVIMRRRLNYLQNILKQDNTSLVYTFFITQLKTRKKTDWVTTVLNDMLMLKIDLTFHEIKKMS